MKMSMRSHVRSAVALLTIACASPAFAQKVTTVPDLTGKQVLEQMANQATGGVAGTAIAAATATEIATVPFGTSSGGFNFKLDPASGLLQRSLCRPPKLPRTTFHSFPDTCPYPDTRLAGRRAI